jgi:hypothetical protein
VPQIITACDECANNLQALRLAQPYVRKYGANAQTVEYVSMFFASTRDAIAAVRFLGGLSDEIPANVRG